ncbi:hypothetical protein [Anaerosporobacter sp.]
MKIPIKDKFTTSEDFSPDEFLVYIALRKIMSSSKVTDSYFICIGTLSHSLCGKQILHKTITSSLLSGMNSLLKKGYIKQIDAKLDTRQNSWVVDLYKLHIGVDKNNKDTYYSLIDSDGIKMILEYDFKNRLSLLKFYCYLMTTIQKMGDKAGVGFTYYKGMSDSIGYAEKTISNYMEILQELQLIYVYKPKFALRDNETGGIQEISQTYGSIEYKDKIIQVGQDYETRYGEEKQKILRPKKSSSRSAAIKYKYILQDVKSGKPIRYPPDEIKEIYESLVEHNERYKDNDCAWMKDLSVFMGYDFYGKSKDADNSS